MLYAPNLKPETWDTKLKAQRAQPTNGLAGKRAIGLKGKKKAARCCHHINHSWVGHFRTALKFKLGFPKCRCSRTMHSWISMLWMPARKMHVHSRSHNFVKFERSMKQLLFLIYNNCARNVKIHIYFNFSKLLKCGIFRLCKKVTKYVNIAAIKCQSYFLSSQNH